MKNMLFIINPSAGRKYIKSKLFEIVDIFTKAGYYVNVYPTQDSGDAGTIIKRESMHYDMIACSGGDGTLDEVVTGYMESGCDIPLGYIPAGTTNDFARSLRIPKDPIIAAKRIVKYKPFQIDIGSLNGNYFVYLAAFGAFTEVSYVTSQRMKNYLGRVAYVLEGVKSLTSLTSYYVEIEHDGVFASGNYIYGMVTNSLSVGGLNSLNSWHVVFDDGLFEAVLIKRPDNAIELQGIITSLMLNEINEDYMYHFKGKNIKIHCDGGIPWTLDGEFGGMHMDAWILNHQKALKIIKK